jgi:hypothetical protein
LVNFDGAGNDEDWRLNECPLATNGCILEEYRWKKGNLKITIIFIKIKAT